MNNPIDGMRISATYLRRLAREHPHPVAILEQLGLAHVAPRDTATVPLAVFFELLRAVERARSDRGWHLAFAQRTADHFHGPLTYVLMSAPTIGKGLEAFAHYVSIRGAYLKGAMWRAGLRHFVGLAETLELGDVRCLLLEVALRIVHDYVAIIGDVNLAAATLYLTYPPDPQRDYYDEGFDCPVRFRTKFNALAIPSAWTAIVNPQYDEQMWTQALHQCDLALAAQHPNDLVTRARLYVQTTLEHDPHSLCIEHAAVELNVSVRTLIRHLRASGTSFQTLRDSARHDVALHLLTKPNLSVEEIARTLGFSDAANFSRAFKRWVGLPPGRYRRQLL